MSKLDDRIARLSPEKRQLLELLMARDEAPSPSPNRLSSRRRKTLSMRFAAVSMPHIPTSRRTRKRRKPGNCTISSAASSTPRRFKTMRFF